MKKALSYLKYDSMAGVNRQHAVTKGELTWNT